MDMVSEWQLNQQCSWRSHFLIIISFESLQRLNSQWTLVRLLVQFRLILNIHIQSWPIRCVSQGRELIINTTSPDRLSTNHCSTFGTHSFPLFMLLSSICLPLFGQLCILTDRHFIKNHVFGSSKMKRWPQSKLIAGNFFLGFNF